MPRDGRHSHRNGARLSGHRGVIATTRAGSMHPVVGYRPAGDGGVWYPRPTLCRRERWPGVVTRPYDLVHPCRSANRVRK
jgi:hypothetical protein